MKHMMRAVAMAAALTVSLAGAAFAQKQGGVLRIYHRDSPSNMSIYEEGTISLVAPMMGVFNNLVVFDPNVKQNSLNSIQGWLKQKADWAWDPYLQRVFDLPAWVVIGIVAIILTLLGRKKKPLIGYARD